MHQIHYREGLSVRAVASTLALCLWAVSTATAQIAQAPSAFGQKSESTTATHSPLTPAQITPGLSKSALTDPLRAHVLPAGASAAGGKAGLTAKAEKSHTNLFDLDDKASIIVSGRQTTAGELKKSVRAEIQQKDGAPRVVQAGVRRSATLELHRAQSGVGSPSRAAAGNTGHAKLLASAAGVSPLPTQSQTLPAPGSKGTAAILAGNERGAYAQASTKKHSDLIKEITCADKGPPAIAEVRSKLIPGGTVTLDGRCFGDRAGRVEVIGQFPGGKLAPPFTAWDMNTVVIQMPANVRGATDHSVAVTVVTAEGKTSAAMQAQFVAARERVEVPARLWSPNANFELSSTEEVVNNDNDVFKPYKVGTSNVNNPLERLAKELRDRQSNRAFAGDLALTLRVNPQCALDAMDANVLRGSVKRITGFEAGPANEAAVRISWGGSCNRLTKTTSYNYGPFQGGDTSVVQACSIAFQVRAWAYCPMGVAP